MHLPLSYFFLAFILIVVGPIAAYYEGRLFRRASGPGRKLSYYRTILTAEWIVALFALLAVGLHPLWSLPDQSVPWLSQYHYLRIAVALAVAVYFAVGLWPVFASLAGERSQRATANALLNSLGEACAILPANAQERLWFAALSVTAGICEELLFRGFLIPFAHVDLHIHLIPALLLSSVIFGLNHLYQGTPGVIQTTIAGVIFGVLYLLTGTLLLPILLHIALDMQVVVILRDGIPQAEPPSA